MQKRIRKLLVLLTILLMMVGVVTGCGSALEEDKKLSTTMMPQSTKEPATNNEEVVAGSFTIHFIDVGQGDCMLLQSDSMNMLIDAGNNKDGKAVVEYLQNVGVTSLDYVVGTHPDADHIGGLDVVIENLQVKNVWMPKKEHTTKTYEDVLLAVKQKGLKIKAPKVGDTLAFGDATITVIGPSKTYESNNDNSIVLRVVHGETSFLLTGDAELEAEEQMLKEGLEISATVLKVGHHGSHSSSSSDFLQAVAPTYAVISCGVDNDYKHPHIETMNALEDVNAIVYRTDLQQTIVMKSDGKDLEITTSGSSAIGDGKINTTNNNVISTSEATSKTYIGNKNSKKFHVESCASLPSEENRIYFNKREEALADSYEACKRCNP